MEENDVVREKKTLSPILGIIIGIAVGIAIMTVLNLFGVNISSEIIATVKGKTITERDIYKNMKELYGMNFMIEEVDKAILNQEYELTDDQKQEIEWEADYYLQAYESKYGCTEEETLYENGYSSKDDFINSLALDYKRTLYLKDYAETLISEEEIEDYYENNIFGEIDSKRILVKISDKVDEEAAKKIAQEIIKKLDSGKTFDEVKEEYKDKITYEELGYINFNSNIEESYVEALKSLENGTYTKEPVETSYGYYIIYRIDQKEKDSLEDIKDDIIDALITKLLNSDKTLSYRALVQMRDDANLSIKDKDIQKQYDEYCESLETTESETEEE